MLQDNDIRILLMRHGQSLGNVDHSAYLKHGDHAVGLTDEGWRQVIAAGEFLGDYYKESNTTHWPTVYLSSYLRPKQSFAGAVHGINGAIPGSPKLYEDPRLIEKFFGATTHIHHPHNVMDAELAEKLKWLSLSVFKKDPFTARGLFGESSKDTLISIKSFLDGTFKRDVDEGKRDFFFSMHGATIQMFLMAWAHLPMASKPEIKNPGNADIIEISGRSKDWRIRRIWDGENMKAVNEAVVDHIKPFAFEDLPAIPEQFL